MRDRQWLARLVGELQRYADSGPHAAAPEIAATDAGEIARALHAEMDRGTAARAAQAERQGERIACHAGCAACCENLIMVFEPEAIAVARWLDDPDHRDARAAFLAAYPRWRRRVGDAPERARAARQGHDQAGYTAAMQQVWRARIPCAFDVEGACAVYPVRPNVCRNCHALDTHEHCAADSPRPPQALDFTPVTQFLARAQALNAAGHAALGAGDGPIALCERVYQLLTDTVTDPGSGRP